MQGEETQPQLTWAKNKNIMIHYKAGKSKLWSWLDLGTQGYHMVLPPFYRKVLVICWKVPPIYISAKASLLLLSKSAWVIWKGLVCCDGSTQLWLGPRRLVSLPNLHHPHEGWADSHRKEVADRTKQGLAMLSHSASHMPGTIWSILYHSFTYSSPPRWERDAVITLTFTDQKTGTKST